MMTDVIPKGCCRKGGGTSEKISYDNGEGGRGDNLPSFDTFLL